VAAVRRQEEREVRSGYWLMAAITLTAGCAVLAETAAVRGLAVGLASLAGWLLYVVRARSREKLSGEALTDPLTGLYNRRYLSDRLGEEAARAQRYGGVFTLALMDIDDFKAFNDHHGHSHGDQVLRAVAASLRNGLRRSDLAFRYGGEEFIVLFPDTPTEIAQEALLRVAGSMPGITFSGGLAEYPTEAARPEGLIDLADSRLRLAKEGGKARMQGRA
jgi:diguanylate cyclase (GGDEF)-like protein